MEAVDVNEKEKFDDVREKLKRMHVLDALEFLETNDNIPKQYDDYLQEIVLSLKSDIPKSISTARIYKRIYNP